MGCALWAAAQGKPAVAERFEAYLGPLEMANGYHELKDADEQRARFEADLARLQLAHWQIGEVVTAPGGERVRIG